MVDLFYGQYKTSIICPKCQHNSTNFSIFLSLQLPIPISNNYFTIKVFLYEEWLDNKDYIYFEIILSKNNNKVIIAKKIIGRLFGISPYQIEIYKTNKMEITKVYNNDEELTENVTFIRAVKINLKTIKDVGNNFEQNIIDYRCIEKRIENRIDDYISFVKNINDNVNNSDDECNIIIDINCGDVENIAEINYEKESLQKFIIKHYTFENDNTKTIIKSIHKDFLIYTKTNQTCYDLYFQIFLVYSSILIVKQLGISEIKDLDDLNKNRDLIKNLFDKYFKRHIEEENQFNDEEIFEIYPELPFFLKLKVYKSKESKFIPKSKKMKFKKFLNSQMEKENKYNENKYKSTDNMKHYEDSKEDSLIKIEINNNNKPNDYENKSLSSKSNINIKNQNYNYDPLNPMNPSIINLGKEKFSSSKSNLVLNGKEKSSKNNATNNNFVHSIIIIFNRNYLNTNGNNEHCLTDITYNKIDLSNIFKHAHQNIEKISINKCFEEFTKMQTLDENNLYKCPKCKENIAARNKIELYKIPKILIIQLKRFENGQKIKTFIDFPIKNLDISSFISNSSQHYLTPPIKYDLFAVSNHYGELEYGHYNASCLNYTDKHWYNFNDKKVEIIEDDNPDSIVTKDAYVLFYRQRKLESIDWKHIYNKQYKDIKDDNYLENININEIKNNNNNLKNNFIIKSGIIELDEEEDEKEVEKDSLVDEEISLDSFVYNPFRDSYLKLKRRRLKEK